MHGFFVVEGIKTIKELLNSSMLLHVLYTTESFNSDNKEEILISEADLKRISFLTTPNKALAIFKIPQPKKIDTSELIVALDAIRDPGNLGTIIRLCDWFGIKNLVCSNETVDCYNPKVVQASTILLLQDWKPLLNTITSDNGKEFANHKEIANELQIDYYFAKPYHSWERGANENLNGLVRQYFPKKTSFANITNKNVEDVIQILNNRPRKRYGYKTPNEMFAEKLNILNAVAFIT